ncbi:hypothetical protein CMK14_25250 [Candidatus Poribacteria bacterium]|nr:hypothetical protein [Candidatus Poribacteria bacterium]
MIPVLVVAFPLGIFEEISGNLYQRALYKSFVVTPVPEEFFKFCVLYYFCSKLRGFDEPMDGIVYGVQLFHWSLPRWRIYCILRGTLE